MSDNSYLASLKEIAVALGASTSDADKAKTVLDATKLIAKAHGASDNDLKDVKTIAQELKAISDTITDSGD